MLVCPPNLNTSRQVSYEFTYVIVPESDQDSCSRDLHGDSDTVGSGSNVSTINENFKAYPCAYGE